MKQTEIILQVALDENHVPEKITWKAPDGGIEKMETKSFMLSVWDEKNKEALRIDLWTKDMPLDEMKIFYHQILNGMAQTYLKASNDETMAQQIQDWAKEFGEKTEILKG